MAGNQRFRGVLVPVVTPFDQTLQPDQQRFSRFCHYVLNEGADGLAVFGTTSEANSVSGRERMQLLEHLVDTDIPVTRLMPGTGACALNEAVDLTRHAVELGCQGVLMLPPFYYKNVSDDGLFAFFSEVIQRVGSEALQLYLYHIPQVSGVGLSPSLVERLVSEYPQTVAGLKDSSGDWNNTQALLERDFADFRVFAGSETFLLDTLRGGGAGCITATGSVHVRKIRQVYENWQEEQADQLQAGITRIRRLIEAYPVIPALKRIIAHYQDDPEWQRTCPPLMPLDDQRVHELIKRLEDEGFSWRT